MRNPIRILALSILFAVAGCSAIVDPEAKDPLNDAQGFCNSVQDVLVDFLQRCEPDSAQIVQMIERWRVGCENLGAAADQGRLGYDRTLAEQCIDTLDGAACAALNDSVLEACGQATPGQVPAGASCTLDGGGLIEECTAGSTCVMTSVCPGTCVPLPTVAGQACGNATNYRCGAGLACGYDSGTSSYSCVTPAPVNAPCNLGECVAGAFCDSRLAPATCTAIPTAPVGAGGDCYWTGDSGCQAGLYCGPGNLCTPVTPLGGACDYGSQCGQPANTCSKAPSGPSLSGTCIPVKQLGQSCLVGNEECASSLWCWGSAVGYLGSCRGLSGPGEVCQHPYASDPDVNGRFTESAWCAEGLYCNDGGAYPAAGVCSSYLGAGAPCANASEACGFPWTGMICDASVVPTGVCTANACAAPFGWLPFF